MNRNGQRDSRDSPGRHRYSPENSDYRREREWNEYVAQGHPLDKDYPRQDVDRRRPEERGRYRDRSPIRDYREDSDRRGWRDSPRDPPAPRERGDYPRDRSRREDRRHGSPPLSRDRESTWSRGACPTVVVNRVHAHIDEKQIRDEVERFGAPSLSVRIEYDQGSNGGNERICIIEFEGTRDAIAWMTEHQGSLRIGRDRLPMKYFDPLGSDRQERSPRRTSRDRERDRDRERYYEEREERNEPRKYDEERRSHGTPSDTMIVKGLDRNTTEGSVRSSFEYITHFQLVDIRLVRDKLGVSRGFCFVQWKNVEECKQVLEYLVGATPRFHIDGKHVSLEFSTPQGVSRKPPSQPASNSAISAAVQVAEAAIQAAHWSQGGKGDGKPDVKAPVTPQRQTPAPKQTPPKPQVPPSPPALLPGQYPPPVPAQFQFDQTSGYYYDATTGLYYDANSRYFYNNFTGQYLYYDAARKIYVPVSSEAQKAEKEKKDKEQKEQKKISAKKIAKDMERWAKAQNKKKEEFKKLMEDKPSGGPGGNKESSTADTVYMMLEKQSSEADRQAAVSAAYKEEMFKMPEHPAGKRAAASDASGGLVSYMNTSDSDEEETPEEEEAKLVDWTKLACLLCRRGFPSKEVLTKHIEMSDLHKQNLEQRRKSRVGTLTKKKAAGGLMGKDTGVDTQIKYRDRAAERRKTFGITEPPLRRNEMRSEAPVPYEQPTKDGLDDRNLGNQMLQKMGWKAGSGLGKSQSGITAPITVKQRSRGAGLGMRGSSYNLDGSEGDYRTAAKKVTYMRYLETD